MFSRTARMDDVLLAWSVPRKFLEGNPPAVVRASLGRVEQSERTAVADAVLLARLVGVAPPGVVARALLRPMPRVGGRISRPTPSADDRWRRLLPEEQRGYCPVPLA
ncbi:unnamed protein product [Prorocentrum cordatum]|uniref:Uncharacterized protein n=1 Tax=Prorocentrum cordatum TaxID=2364126 RepID=A0ABN9SX39_9DINO|nr:unnamed protein product [Polarella glacialis]